MAFYAVKNIVRSPSPKFRDALAQLPYLPRAFALVWAAARRWTVAWAALLLA